MTRKIWFCFLATVSLSAAIVEWIRVYFHSYLAQRIGEDFFSFLAPTQFTQYIAVEISADLSVAWKTVVYIVCLLLDVVAAFYLSKFLTYLQRRFNFVTAVAAYAGISFVAAVLFAGVFFGLPLRFGTKL